MSRIRIYIQSISYEFWDTIENEYDPPTIVVDGLNVPKPKYKGLQALAQEKEAFSENEEDEDIALPTRRFKRFLQQRNGARRGLQNDEGKKNTKPKGKEKGQCYNCHRYGHISECNAPRNKGKGGKKAYGAT
ncbi:hypothetical protein F0562_028325 [Nyssa sinensis]|uniref:CCHC-type domain-containing protein n=1 Tax=Nyssa sinensis TaxID=561372 RepID=A0A5J5B7Y0_9ASTE|nr:hypothetical protein F0562_028325 [Nyssa sinensis]